MTTSPISIVGGLLSRSPFSDSDLARTRELGPAFLCIMGLVCWAFGLVVFQSLIASDILPERLGRGLPWDTISSIMWAALLLVPAVAFVGLATGSRLRRRKILVGRIDVASRIADRVEANIALWMVWSGMAAIGCVPFTLLALMLTS